MDIIIADNSDKIKNLGHLSLIDTIMKEFKLVDLFDSLLPKNRDHHITNGEAIYDFLKICRKILYNFGG